MHDTYYAVTCHDVAVHGPGPRVGWSGQLLNLNFERPRQSPGQCTEPQSQGADMPDERRMSSIVGKGGTYLAGSSESLSASD
jgi:hypothetical protein